MAEIRNRLLKGKTILQIISAIIIPLLIACATILITIQQNHLNKAIRDNELTIADRQYKQEHDLAEQQRQEHLLDNYIREISQLLLSINFTKTYAILEYIIRPQTLAVIRQINTYRKRKLIQFLIETSLLRSQENPVSLVDANLDGLNFDIENDRNYHSYLFFLSLPRTSLVNASFRNQQLRFADFRHSALINASFQNASLFSAEFYAADLRNASFLNADLRFADFSHTDLTGCDLTEDQLNNQILSLSNAILPDGKTRGQPKNLIVNGDAELGSTFGWNLTNPTFVEARKYVNQINSTYGQWNFRVTNEAFMVSMWQRISLDDYVNLMLRGGMSAFISLEYQPVDTQPDILIRTFINEFEETRIETATLTYSEIRDTFCYAFGTYSLPRKATFIELTVRFRTAKLIDNIHMSIQHTGLNPE